MIDFTKLQMSSAASSNKVLLEGQGSFTVPSFPSSGEAHTTATIPHNFGSDNLLFQVQATTDIAGTSGWTMLPWSSGDGRVFLYAYIDSVNLYVVRNNNDSGGFGWPATTTSYFYRILVP